MPKGSQEEVMTPGQNEKYYLAGALNLTTGEMLHGLGHRKTNALFRDLLTLLDHTYPAPRVSRIAVVVDNSCIHKAKAVEQWWQSHPRFVLLWFPTDCPRANPIERAFGDVTTSARAITNARACVSWSAMSRGIYASMAHGATSYRGSMRSPR